MKIIKLLSTLSLVAGIGLSTVSCLDTENDDNYTTFGFLPATNLYINHDSIQPIGKPTNVKITYSLTGNCQKFIEFKKLSTSTPTSLDIGAYGSQDNSVGCTNDIRYETKTINFTPTESGKNVIRVWAGNDLEGRSLYITDTINVPNE